MHVASIAPAKFQEFCIVVVVVHKGEKSKQRCKKWISTDVCVLALGAESANAKVDIRVCGDQVIRGTLASALTGFLTS